MLLTYYHFKYVVFIWWYLIQSQWHAFIQCAIF